MVQKSHFINNRDHETLRQCPFLLILPVSPPVPPPPPSWGEGERKKAVDHIHSRILRPFPLFR